MERDMVDIINEELENQPVMEADEIDQDSVVEERSEEMEVIPNDPEPSSLGEDRSKDCYGKHSRTISIDRSYLDEEERSVQVAFSSEQPVSRGWGIEVLDHDPKSIRTQRISDSAPLLLEHDPSKHIGVIENVSVGEDRVARASVRFGRSALAEEVFQDVKDGIKRHISVGYVIHAVENTRENDQEIYRATDWEPLEISWVSVPADHTVGYGRSEDSETNSNFNSNSQNNSEVKIVSEQKDNLKEVEDVRAKELARIGDLENLGAQHGEQSLAREFIRDGKNVDEFRSALLDQISNRPVEKADANIGMSEADKRRWSLSKVLRHLANPTDTRAREEASFEIECSEVAQKQAGREARGVMMPYDMMHRDISGVSALVGTEHLGSSFIDVLSANSVVFPLTTKLTGLQGNLSIPRMTAGTSTAYVAEDTAVAETTPTFDSISLAPSTLGTYTQISRKMLIQGDPSVEQMVMNDLARAMAVKIDETILNGSGTGAEPTGILNLSGMSGQTVVNGTNGDIETWAKVVEYESLVNAQNASGAPMYYVLHPSLAGAWKTKAKDTGSGLFNMENGMANGYKVLTTTVLPTNLTKGASSNCIGTVFGDFSSAIMAMWGGLDILTDPYTHSDKGTLRVVGLQDLDVNFRHKESFSISKDSLSA